MRYKNKNVYDAAMERIGLVFNEFDNIYVSFSGGKDSGLVLNLCLQHMRDKGITRKIGLFHQDFEAQYTETTKYVKRTFADHADMIDPYWVCLPMSCKTATSMYEQYWTPWDEAKRDIWVRKMPENCINLANHQFDFYTHAMMQEDLYAAFGGWYHRFIGKGKGKTIGLVGIRAQESLNRWRAITQEKGTYRKIKWTTRNEENVYSAYPVYDWKTEDVWTANARFGFDYNKLYDLFYYSGVPLHSMRVASPFNDWAIGSLKLYRVIEPDIWAAMIGRVQGANFCSIYGGTKAAGWKNIDLPPGHTWQSYVQFLLSTLPEETRKTYEEKFATSIEFWRTKGGVLTDATIVELRAMGIDIKENGKSNYKTDKTRVVFEDYPDDLNVKEFQSVPSYKRMAICIMKNDHLCKYMGFSQTQEEAKRRAEAIEKYKDL
ncbi:MAG: DUF3440 domain-containing protein [Planctomycetaceae bacterium]|jgi:predicted phosphoadenosine phosphosulfate sulfurtransferase|nr:DUF3440 domain-containing protein [Planctomycetaceae bacterium]